MVGEGSNELPSFQNQKGRRCYICWFMDTFVVDNSIYLMSTLRVCMNGEMRLPSSLIIWFEGCSSGPSHSHFFLLFILIIFLMLLEINYISLC